MDHASYFESKSGVRITQYGECLLYGGGAFQINAVIDHHKLSCWGGTDRIVSAASDNIALDHCVILHCKPFHFMEPTQNSNNFCVPLNF